MKNKMKWEKVKSGNITAVAYFNGDLYVKFHGDRVYTYPDTPKVQYDRLLDADIADDKSVGKEFNQHIKGNFSYKRLEEKKDEGDKDEPAV